MKSLVYTSADCIQQICQSDLLVSRSSLSHIFYNVLFGKSHIFGISMQLVKLCHVEVPIYIVVEGVVIAV